VSLDGRAGIVLTEDAAAQARNGHRTARSYLNVHLSTGLLPVLMPLLARLRRYFDLDAEPTMVDAHLAQGGLGRQVEGRPGVRIPGVLDGFEAVLRTVLSESPAGARAAVAVNLGEHRFGDRHARRKVDLQPHAARFDDHKRRLQILVVPMGENGGRNRKQREQQRQVTECPGYGLRHFIP
jgi:3-methyladenine DNA glycosylase/8-oxoguanine DNA glycosylase